MHGVCPGKTDINMNCENRATIFNQEDCETNCEKFDIKFLSNIRVTFTLIKINRTTIPNGMVDGFVGKSDKEILAR